MNRPRIQGGPGRNGRNQQSRQQGGGQRGNNRPQWQQRNLNQATGANDTPLGTPVRMSPVNDTPVVKENTQKSQPVAATPKKRKVDPETTEPKVHFYQLPGLCVLTANRMPLNRLRRRKRSRKTPRVCQRQPRPAS